MRNTSESAEVNEQAKNKTTGTKNRTSTRLKPESATTASQEQEETKPVTRRRSPSTRSTSTTASSATATEQAAPAQDGAGSASVATGTTARKAPAQRNKASSTPAPAHPESTTPTTAGTATPVQQTSRGTTAAQAQAQSAGKTAAPTQRQAPATPQRRTTASSSAAAQVQSRPASPTTQARPATKTAGSSSQAVAARPGSAARPATARPGTASHAARPGAPTQRSQERRVAPVKEKPTGPVSIPPQIIVKDLAELLDTTPTEVIRGLIKHGVFASINQVVDYEKAALIAQELGFEPHQSAVSATPGQRTRGLSTNEILMASRNEGNLVEVPPVVTIMGHVDHGKTTLLDTIRKTKVAESEAGGITQHIGAYQVEVDSKKITFLDTPGHEAFTAMRARGAQVTHIAVIVVAADDGVMPQTREAIDHARAAGVPIIIALNKIDKANANPDRVKQQLAEIGVVIEEYGGDVVLVPVSARRGTGIDDLLEMILLVAEMQDIKANPNRPAVGTIIEAKLDKSSGPMATVLVQQGTLKMGDNIVVGSMAGKVRAMFNDRGKRIQKATPSTPVSILGLPEVPNAGDHLEVASDERTARQMAQKVAEQRRSESGPLGQVSLDTLYMQEGNVKELNIVLKGDVQGTVEAIKNALSKLNDEHFKVRLIHEGVGNISETDVHLAAASGAIIIGFDVKADGAAQRLAQKEGVDIRYYNVIYKLIDDIQAALKGMLEPTYREVIDGHAEVLQTFKSGKNIIIAGCRVTDGKIARSSQARVLRKDTKVFDGKIASLRRGKDDVREVAAGYECGVVIEDFNDVEIGDIIETYSQVRVNPGA